MKKPVAVALALSLAAVLSAESRPVILPRAVPEPGEYVMIITGCDWGPAITKVVVNTGRAVRADDLWPEDFDVAVTLNKTDGDGRLGLGVATGELPVTGAYLSDGEGNRSDARTGAYVALETAYGPDVPDGDPFFHFPRAPSMSPVCGLSIKNAALGLAVSVRTAAVSPLAGQFSFGEVSVPGVKKPVSLTYAWWLPGADAGKIPLIVWFHGMGESGTNPYLPLLGTKTTALISDTVQRHFPGGAAVLVPQCPTGWLESTDEGAFGVRMWVTVDSDTVKKAVTKPVKNILGKVFVSGSKKEKSPVATVSYYTEAALTMIDEFLAAHPEIDRNRIYVGGCSAGGYMTLNLCLRAPGLFAAAFPVCEAFPDEKLSAADLAALAKIPLWFTCARNDTTLRPDRYTLATTARLAALPQADLRTSVFDDVHDTGDRWFAPAADELAPRTDLPWQYPGHWSWIYVLNGQCAADGETLFEWLSRQSR